MQSFGFFVVNLDKLLISQVANEIKRVNPYVPLLHCILQLHRSDWWLTSKLWHLHHCTLPQSHGFNSFED